MMALAVHLLALTSAFVPAPVVQPPVQYYEYAPSTQFLGRADLVMNTNYGDPNVKKMYTKKDPRTGSTKGLKGYTVGSRAPPIARASGTTAKFGYGIDNLYGGKKIVNDTRNPPKTSDLGLILLAVAVFFLVASAK